MAATLSQLLVVADRSAAPIGNVSLADKGRGMHWSHGVDGNFSSVTCHAPVPTRTEATPSQHMFVSQCFGWFRGQRPLIKHIQPFEQVKGAPEHLVTGFVSFRAGQLAEDHYPVAPDCDHQTGTATSTSPNRCEVFCLFVHPITA